MQYATNTRCSYLLHQLPFYHDKRIFQNRNLRFLHYSYYKINPIKTKTIIMSEIHTGFSLEFGREGLVSLLARIWELLSNNMVSLKMVMNEKYLKKKLVEF